MGKKHSRGDWDKVAAVSVTCPDRLYEEKAVVDIRQRGNLPLLVGDRVLAELTRADLAESWDTTCALTPAELASLCRSAGERLTRALEDDIEAADVAEIVTDAAVLFLLGVRRHGVRTPEDIPACTVSFDAASGKETFALSY